jgi:hypothetical protein
MNELNGYDIEDLSVDMSATFSKTITEADIVLFAGVSADTTPCINEEFAATTSLRRAYRTRLSDRQRDFGRHRQQAARAGRLALAREHRITQTPQNDRVVPSEERQMPEITA